jgi:hypothetical protein
MRRSCASPIFRIHPLCRPSAMYRRRRECLAALGRDRDGHWIVQEATASTANLSSAKAPRLASPGSRAPAAKASSASSPTDPRVAGTINSLRNRPLRLEERAARPWREREPPRSALPMRSSRLVALTAGEHHRRAADLIFRRARPRSDHRAPLDAGR